MNSETNQTECRRARERYVWEAMECVQRWRDIFENGFYDEGGNFTKVTLKQAAAIVGVSKKTLEDYHSILRKASDVIDLMRVLDKKMGYLRQLLKEMKSQPAPCKEQMESEGEQLEWDNMIIADIDSGKVQYEDEFEDYGAYFDQNYLEYQREDECQRDEYSDYYCNPALPDL